MRPLSLSIACLLLSAAVSSQQPEAPTQVRSHSSDAVVPTVRLSGTKLLAHVRGDNVHPALSPDGTRLAYSKVIAAGGSRNCSGRESSRAPRSTSRSSIAPRHA